MSLDKLLLAFHPKNDLNGQITHITSYEDAITDMAASMRNIPKVLFRGSIMGAASGVLVTTAYTLLTHEIKNEEMNYLPLSCGITIAYLDFLQYNLRYNYERNKHKIHNFINKI